MKRASMAMGLLALCLTTGCTNFLYQGELTAKDAYGKERQFVIYWTKTDPLLGEAKAGPAILLTECSPLTRISFDEQAEGLIFRGTPGFDRLPGGNGTIGQNAICGKINNYAQWKDAREGALAVAILCHPVSDEMAAEPRNYLAANNQPYIFSITEKEKRWSILGETLPGPSVPECRHR